jgi:Flp pilus assembly protein TadD
MDTDLERYFAEARAIVEAGHYPQAVEVLRQLPAAAPDDAEAHFFLGVTQMKQQHWDAAID